MVGPDELAATLAFLAEFDNLRAAVEWAVTARETHLALRLMPESAWLPLFSSAPLLEMAAWAESSSASTMRLDDRRIEPACSGCLTRQPRGRPPTLLRRCDDAERALERGARPVRGDRVQPGICADGHGQLDAASCRVRTRGEPAAQRR
jgi:hypothetical protein